jgi:hypothetical protein
MLAEPFSWATEIGAFRHDPDGRLFELNEQLRTR